MGVRTGTFKEDNWRGSMGIIHSRRSTTLLALLLITISLMTYSFNDAIEFNTLPSHDSPDINIPKDAITESQQPKKALSSSSKLPIATPGGSDVLNAPPEQHLLAESSLNTSVDQSIPTASSPSPKPLSNGVPLRVMFLDSPVIRGDMPADNLVFRSSLRDKLAALGNPINLVGSQAFIDDDLEAYSESLIGQTHEHATHIVPSTKPNVIVLSIGDGDCLRERGTGDVGDRMRDLVAYLFEMSPRATLILSTLLTSTRPDVELCVLDLNVQIRKLASALQREGRPVVLAEMHCEQGLPDRPLPGDISSDGTQPSDHGYGLMEEILFSSFVDAGSRGFFKAPEDSGVLEEEELGKTGEGGVVELEVLPS
ncbi:carbohydrate esterase family 3 protein [Nemania diffusa]|nr:carbohydrate esterase family 3 protein [Nemania diffusa]